MIDYTNWSRQDIFDKVAEGLLKQNKRSKLHATMDAEGNKCALGMLIPNNCFPAKRGLCYGIELVFGNVPRKFHEILNNLQDIHDTYKYDPSYWPRQLRDIAIKYDLEIKDYLKEKLND